jgi:hypothetical protein
MSNHGAWVVEDSPELLELMAGDEEGYSDYCSGLAGLVQGLSDTQAAGVSRLVLAGHMAEDLEWEEDEEGAGGGVGRLWLELDDDDDDDDALVS